MTDLDLLRAELASVKEQRDTALRLADRLEEQLFRERLARTLPGIPLHGEPATEAEMRLGRDPFEALLPGVGRLASEGVIRPDNPVRDLMPHRGLRLVVDNDAKESA